jgi:hypothetical protein
MKKVLSQFVLAAFVVAVPCAAQSQMMSASVPGAGPHGYDWAVGTWSCTNTMPSAMGGPSHQSMTVTRTNGGAIMYHSVGANFDSVFYNVYVAKTKTWWSPLIVSDGTYGTESSSTIGKKMVWIGTASNTSGTSMQIRDTVTYSMTKTTDLGEYKSGGPWREQYNVTCVRT